MKLPGGARAYRAYKTRLAVPPGTIHRTFFNCVTTS